MASASPVLNAPHSVQFPSAALGRTVTIDFYLPPGTAATRPVSLLLINDGQDLLQMPLDSLLEGGYRTGAFGPMLCVGIHSGPDRKKEYGTAHLSDFKGRGNKAAAYTEFIMRELLPYIGRQYAQFRIRHRIFAGFSLGGLSALDIAWNQPGFTHVGIFSGSFWWRSVGQDDPGYHDDLHRIMHARIRETDAPAGLRFFFECGTMDETADRNNNGVIDSIDDTMDLIHDLMAKGYQDPADIRYLEIRDGKHDVATWAMAMPVFLDWIFG